MTGRPRLSVELSQAQSDGLQRMLDYGEQKALFSAIVDSLLKLHSSHGKMAIYAIIVGKADYIEVLARQAGQKEKVTSGDD